MAQEDAAAEMAAIKKAIATGDSAALETYGGLVSSPRNALQNNWAVPETADSERKRWDSSATCRAN